MTDVLAIAICQVPLVVGDIDGNRDRLLAARDEAAAQGADLAVFSELCVSGYPTEDLVRKPAFLDACEASLAALRAASADGGPAMIVGAPLREDGVLYNCAVLLDGGAEVGRVRKVRLPNYGVFDEPRRFAAGGEAVAPIPFHGLSVGLMVCEDMWLSGVGETLAANGADLLIAPHGSPYRADAVAEREAAARRCALATGKPIVFVNQLAGQDEVVFDAGGFVMSADGLIVARAPQFEEAVEITRWSRAGDGWACVSGPQANWCDGVEKDYRAAVLGLRAYVLENGFSSVVLGLSGGIDSALVAAMATDALGPSNVRCVMLPSRYTSRESLDDAAACAELLDVAYEIIPIGGVVEAFTDMLSPTFRGQAEDVTEENLQSRIRGTTLMALSNKTGRMLLTTGNKSEVAVGYATLYGDMNGGYNPIKDVYKTDCYRMCEWRNGADPDGLLGRKGPVIPDRILTKAPSAELRDNQTDQDSLPPYDVLDAILKGLVEEEKSVADLLAGGHDLATVKRVERLLYLAEYKRRQSAPGPKLTSMNFGRDRRYPITQKWRDDTGRG